MKTKLLEWLSGDSSPFWEMLSLPRPDFAWTPGVHPGYSCVMLNMAVDGTDQDSALISLNGGGVFGKDGFTCMAAEWNYYNRNFLHRATTSPRSIEALYLLLCGPDLVTNHVTNLSSQN